MTNEELDRLQAISEAATPGPWETDGDYIEPSIGEAWRLHGAANPANGKFVVEARSAVPALIAEVRRLRTNVPELEVASTWQPIETAPKYVVKPKAQPDLPSDNDLPELPCDRCFIRPGSLTCLGCKLNFNNAVGS